MAVFALSDRFGLSPQEVENWPMSLIVEAAAYIKIGEKSNGDGATR